MQSKSIVKIINKDLAEMILNKYNIKLINNTAVKMCALSIQKELERAARRKDINPKYVVKISDKGMEVGATYLKAIYFEDLEVSVTFIMPEELKEEFESIFPKEDSKEDAVEVMKKAE